MRLIEADWPAPAGLFAGTTTRDGGVSTGPYESLNLGAHVGDDAAAVDENRRRLGEFLGLAAAPRWLAQVHGARVVHAGSRDFAAATPEADAVVSRDGKAVLGILTADCLPLLVCDTATPGIAAVHCGWKSLAAGIVDTALEALGCEPSGLMAWLGPAISQSAFEVGDEVRDLFLAGIENAASAFRANARGRWQADLPGLVRLYLGRAGVRRVYSGGHCTYAEPERFFSYRRDGRCGRMATLIGRR